MPKKTSIMIAEDQTLVRKAFISLLEEANFKVIGEADNGKDLLDLLKQNLPDIVILDIEMPVMGGKETLEIIHKRFPTVKVIMLSMHAELNYMSAFMEMGASAYLPKACDVEILIEAINTVKTKGQYFSPGVAEALLSELKKEKNIHPLHDEAALSDREKEILKILCEGKTNKEIGASLHISPNTVDYHRGNIYAKTKSKNITDLVKYAIKHGVISIS